MCSFQLLAMVVGLAAVCSAKSYSAEKFDVQVRMQPDSSLEIVETVRFHFESDPFSFVVREISKRGIDRIVVTGAEMDGVRVAVETEEDGQGLRVKWRFRAEAGSRHEFVLRYVAKGVVSRRDGGAVLVWNAIPERHGYAIEGGEIRFEYPAGLSFGGEPAVAVAEASSHEVRRSRFVLGPLGVNERAALRVVFAGEAGGAAVAAGDSPWLWGAGAAAGVVAVGVVVWVVFGGELRHNPVAPRMEVGEVQMPPAVAGRLLAQVPGYRGALATLFDLARRGIVRIRHCGKKRYGREGWDVELGASRGGLLAFEEAVLRRVFRGSGPSRVRDFADVAEDFVDFGPEFNQLVEEWMSAEGLLDFERREGRGRWIRWTGYLCLVGCVGIVAGLVFTARAAQAGRSMGPPSLITGVGVGAVLLAVVGRIRFAFILGLSALGAARAAGPRACLRELAGAIRSRSDSDFGDFDRYLPFAVAAGMGSAWVKRFRAEGSAVPVWLETEADGIDRMTFFDTAIVSGGGSDCSGSDGGGGDSGSGGGSSDAG